MRAIGIGMILSLMVVQNVFICANGNNIVNLTGLTPNINYILEQKKLQEEVFELEIQKKYPKAKVNNVDEGVKHIKVVKYYSGKPVRINIVEYSPNINDRLEVSPAIASKTLASRTKICSMANRENALVAINGGYFKPETGVPLGMLMIDKKIYTGPIYDRVAMGIFDNGFDMARIQLKSFIKTNKGVLVVDNINQPRMLSTHTIVYTSDWGLKTPVSPKYGKQLVIRNNKLEKVTANSTEIPEDGYVIIGAESNLNKIVNASDFKLKSQINPEWEKVNHIIGGGPYLVKNGEVFVDMSAERLNSIGGRNPRTAIGYTKDNNLILITADGREGSSIGLTLMELAQLMKDLGCVNAMNLDGGGSTVMYVKGQVVNKPQVQGGIPLSHVLAIKRVS